MIHHKGSLAMYHIYALKCEELVLYVGQTVDMYNRFYKHKSRHKDCSSKDIPEDMDFYMDLLEIVDTIEEATRREQFFYDTLKPFYNKQRPGQTRKEYNKEYKREWRKANKEEIKEYNREYRRINKN